MQNPDENDAVKKQWAQYHGTTTDDPELKKYFSAAEKFIEAIRKSAGKLLGGVKEEGAESRQMAQTFFRMLSEKLNLENRQEPPSPEEVKEAISQLKDVGRLSFFISFSLLPGGAALLIALELLARSYGIQWFTFVPSSFRPGSTGRTGQGRDIPSGDSQ